MAYNSDEYFNSSDFKATLRRFEDAEKTGGSIMLDSEDYVDIAEYYYNNGDVRRAHEILDRTMEIYPGAAAPLLFKARMALLDDNDIEKARYYTEQIEDKTDLEYYYIKAEIMIVEGLTDEADKYLEECFTKISDEDKDYFAIDSAAIFLDYAALDKAEKWLGRSNETGLEEYKEQYARIMFEKGEYEESRKLFNELIDGDPYSTKYWNSLASSQFLCQDIEGAIHSSEYALAIDPDNIRALLNKANSLYHLGNYKEAVVFYLRYNKLCPDDDNCEMLLGFCYIILEDYEKAVFHFEKAAELSTEDSANLTDIYKEWAYALCRLDRMEESMSVLDKAEQTDCNKDMMLVYRGELLHEGGQPDKGNECFINAITNSGGSPEIIMKVAMTFFEKKNINAAYKLFNFLFQRNRQWHDGHAYLAVCCYELDKKDEFLESLKKAAKHNPSETKMMLGDLFPKDMEVKDYYQYMYDKLNKTNNNAV